jgi:DNA (cytosine-5)-methyltransferase 1
MIYGSVCSGIEAATMAWHPLGWKPAFFSEIDQFPCKVLKHHYSDTPNLGDMTKFKDWPDANIDVLVGGTPCQSFSIAGLRKGLDDPRGNLMLTYLSIADKYRPKWIVWENVFGVLSSNKGLDFAAFLTGLGELGYGFAYRVLDAQYVRTDGHTHAVPQRRRRVFVVGCLGDWRSAAAVLFDSESLSRNTSPSRQARQDITEVSGTLSANAGGLNRAAGQGNELDFCVVGKTGSGKETFGTLMANAGTKQWLGNQEALSGDYHVIALAGNTIGRQPENGGNGTGYDDTGASYTLTKTDVHAVTYATHEVAGTMLSRKDSGGFSSSIDHAAAGYIALNNQMQVRRLTPKECARLQGFPDDYLSQVPGASDSAIYKALGNSMAVNVMECIGQRIKMVDAIAAVKATA